MCTQHYVSFRLCPCQLKYGLLIACEAPARCHTVSKPVHWQDEPYCAYHAHAVFFSRMGQASAFAGDAGDFPAARVREDDSSDDSDGDRPPWVEEDDEEEEAAYRAGLSQRDLWLYECIMEGPRERGAKGRAGKRKSTTWVKWKKFQREKAKAKAKAKAEEVKAKVEEAKAKVEEAKAKAKEVKAKAKEVKAKAEEAEADQRPKLSESEATSKKDVVAARLDVSVPRAPTPKNE
ncbi:hypothetical protein F4781DRAFT_442350 [Annulohypoxylon bovei var. microspora]|nr:hypothetical protein F4781DRAFT_442350 [Annulohypoxylon bovei var. microspora]